jgi:hypothetical protein
MYCKCSNHFFVEYKDSIKIYNHKTIGEKTQYIIHHPNEFFWIISKCKTHDQQLKKDLFKLEGNILYISLLNKYQGVA